MWSKDVCEGDHCSVDHRRVPGKRNSQCKTQKAQRTVSVYETPKVRKAKVNGKKAGVIRRLVEAGREKVRKSFVLHLRKWNL